MSVEAWQFEPLNVTPRINGALLTHVSLDGGGQGLAPHVVPIPWNVPPVHVPNPVAAQHDPRQHAPRHCPIVTHDPPGCHCPAPQLGSVVTVHPPALSQQRPMTWHGLGLHVPPCVQDPTVQLACVTGRHVPSDVQHSPSGWHGLGEHATPGLCAPLHSGGVT